MQQQLQKNLNALESRLPGLNDLIENRRDSLLEKENLIILQEQADNGETILRVQQGERKLYLAGKRDPVLPAVNQVSLLEKIEHTAPVFILGMGNIHYLEEVLKQSDESVVILLYEPLFSIFYKQLELIDIDKIFGEHVIALLIGGINDDGMERIMISMLKGDRAPLARHIILPNYRELCLEESLKFSKMIREIMSSYETNVLTQIRFSSVAVENHLENLEYVRTGYKAGQLQNILPLDIPAIVVSAGPSLNKNIGVLKKAKNKAFIIAVDTAVKPLIKAGIVPDMFAIVDGLKPLELVEMEEARQIPLITTTNAAFRVLKYHKGKKFFFNEGFSDVNKMFDMNKMVFEYLAVGGSVATLAFSIAFHVGYKKIILVGQDLSYPGNRTHVDGSFHDKMPEIDTSNYQMVPGNVEETVPSDIQMITYRKWFENVIKQWETFDLKVINATEGGAKIEGTEIMTLEEAIEKNCGKEVDISGCFNELRPVFTEEQQKDLLKYFHEIPFEYEQIIQKAKHCRKQYIKLKQLCTGKNFDKKAYLKLLSQIKKDTKVIEKNNGYQLISETITLADKLIQTAQYIEYESFVEEGMDLAEKGIIYIELVEECATLFKGLAKDTVAKLD